MQEIVVAKDTSCYFYHSLIVRYAELKGIEVYSYQFLISEDPDSTFGPYQEDGITAKGIIYTSRECKCLDDAWKYDISDIHNIKRDDSALLQAIKEIDLIRPERERTFKIIEIPDDVEWEIEGDDMGYEWVAEKHRTWH